MLTNTWMTGCSPSRAARSSLDFARAKSKPRMNREPARTFEDIGREDEIHHPRLVFEGDEHDAARSHGTLPREDEPRDLHAEFRGDICQSWSLVMTPRFFIRARRWRIGWSATESPSLA